MKRLLSIFLVLILTVTAFSGCTSAPKPSEAKGIKIAIVTSPSGVDDGNFNQNIYNGILKYIQTNSSATVNAVREETGDVARVLQTVADIVADYDIIVCCGFQFAGIGSLAQENPEKRFILVDAYPTDASGTEVAVDNIYAMQFAEQESGFFAGMAAALQSQTKKVAVMNGVAYPSNVNYQYGFEAGVNYANAKYNTGVQAVEIASYAGTDVTGANVGGNYVGNFADPATGKVVANALIDEGCDILFVAAGGSGNGAFTAAKEGTGVMVIGCDVDQYDDGASGDKNVVLTSVLKVMDLNVEKQLNLFAEGKFVGGNALLKADTDSTGFVSAEGRQQLSADTISKLNDAMALLKDGKIELPTNFNGITPDNFPGLS